MKLVHITLAAFVAAPAVLAQGADCPDQAPHILKARIDLGATAPLAAIAEAAPANVLWTMNAADNATCVRGMDDINGDGVPDVASGHDILGSGDNFFAISGASAGTGSVIWQTETTGGASGGSFYGDHCMSVGSDYNGDGIRDLLVGLGTGGRTGNVFDATDGSIIWQFDTYNEFESGWVYNIREMPDVTGDGTPEVIFGCGSKNDSVYLIDGSSTGLSPTKLWSYRALDAVFSVNWVPDVSGDGLPDVIAGSGDNDGRIYCLRSDTGEPVWIHDPGGTVWEMSVIEDVDGDGKNDIVAATWAAGNHATCISSATGAFIWGANVGGLGMQARPLEDITGDGISEIIVGSWANAITVVDGSDGAIVWSTPTGVANGGDVWTVSSIPDLNGDGNDDVVAGSFDLHFYCCDGVSGAVLWSAFTNNRVFSASWMGDVNGDGKPEAICGTQDTANKTVVYAVEGDSGLIPPYFVLSGSGAIGTTSGMNTTGIPGDQYFLFVSNGTASIPVGPFGNLLLDPAVLLVVGGGLIPSNGTAEQALPIPNDPALIGAMVHFQSLVGANLLGGVGAFTNRGTLTVN